MTRKFSRAKAKKPPFGVFLAAVVVFFVAGLSVSDSIGFVPCEFDGTCDRSSSNAASSNFTEFGSTSVTAVQAEGILPTHIEINAIGLDLPVQNPTTTDLEALDSILQKGPARHAQTGKLGDNTNMVIFGHSSHLPIVHNQMYKAFNRVPELTAGDAITLTGENGAKYLYSVASVTKEDAGNFTENFVEHPDRQLIIVTCDTLSGKSARFIVRADFVSVTQ